MLVLGGLVLASAAACSDCGWRSSRTRPDVITVRWPPTSPAGREQEASTDSRDADTAEALLQPTDVAPGVRVRQGMADDLSYFEVILGDADFDTALPLVVLLHGRGDRPRIPGGPFGGVPIPMRLVIPRGPLQLGAGFAWMLSSVTHGQPELLASELRERTDHVAALIRTVHATRPTIGRPVVAGFSQGALLAFSLALHRPDVVGRVFPLAGWVPPALIPVSPVSPELRVPIRTVHGTDDRVIPIGPTREVVALLRALEWDVELLEFEGVGHVISHEMNATFEAWLEESLRALAPALTGKGLGQAGPEEETYEPFEPLDPETIEAIEELLVQEAAPSTGTDAPSDVTDEDIIENRDESDDAVDGKGDDPGAGSQND